jgi:ribosomal protein L36
MVSIALWTSVGQNRLKEISRETPEYEAPLAAALKSRGIIVLACFMSEFYIFSIHADCALVRRSRVYFFSCIDPRFSTATRAI